MFYCIDKAPGVTTREAVKKLLHIKGRGFGVEGILDPFASGLLVAATGESTRFLSYFLQLPKTYCAEMLLGAETDTLDNTGDVTRRADVTTVSQGALRNAESQFSGEITQVPPIYSNLKIEGRRAHEIARAGGEVDLKPRQVRISKLSLALTGPGTITMECTVSSGTYIRSLARDIAQSLGTYGHLTRLRRICIGDFAVSSRDGAPEPPGLIFREMSDLDALSFFEEISLAAADADRFLHGAFIRTGPRGTNRILRVTAQGKFLGLAMLEGEMLKPQKVYPTN